MRKLVGTCTLALGSLHSEQDGNHAVLIRSDVQLLQDVGVGTFVHHSSVGHLLLLDIFQLGQVRNY